VLLGTGVLPGYRWHALARAWRTPLLGELSMAATTRAGFRLLLSRGNPRGLPRAFVERMYDDFDRHTRRAVLDLYRSVPDVAAAGERLAAALRPLDRPALVLWGRHDPYLPAALADRQRDAFPHADIRVLQRSGHWAFVDDPQTVTAAIKQFLARHADAHTDPTPRPRIAAELQAARHATTGTPPISTPQGEPSHGAPEPSSTSRPSSIPAHPACGTPALGCSFAGPGNLVLAPTILLAAAPANVARRQRRQRGRADAATAIGVMQQRRWLASESLIRSGASDV